MELIERFLNYTKHDTQSSEESSTVPSVPSKHMPFARYIVEELKSEGLSDVEMDTNGYVYATLPSNIEKDVPVIGFIAHYDTSPDCSGCDVRPRIVERYDGGDIVLSEGIVSSPSRFPELLDHIGEDLIVTDGRTLLGADDKAGIAEIVQAMVWLMQHPEIRHGKIRIAFNPDEEIGMGARNFDVQKFGCQWAYTIDGSDIGNLEYENFNAASAKVSFKGVSVHPGYAKGKMLNANLLALEYASMMPADERPETTEGYQGFYHLLHTTADIEHATLHYIIRDHDRQRFEQRKQYMQSVADSLNDKYGSIVCEVAVTDQYYNMKEKISPQMHVIDIVLRAMQDVGVTPKVEPIRGGTDGAQLSFMGLPCPNIFAGGVNFHGPYEFVSCQVMEKAMQTIVRICQLTALSCQ